MPLKSGPPRECTSEAPCGVAIGPFRNANNGHTCGPPSALYTYRRAAVPEIQSVEERENVPPGCQNRLLFRREIDSFSVLRKYCYQKDRSSEAVGEASFACPTDAFSNGFSKKGKQCTTTAVAPCGYALCTHRARDRRSCRHPRAALLGGAFR